MIRTRHKPTRATKDGRLILSRKDYTALRLKMYDLQIGECACGDHEGERAVIFRDFILHHPSGRGLGGGKRDDREVVGWCSACHDAHHAKLDGWITAKIA